MGESRIEQVARALWKARAAHFGEPAMPLVKDERYELFKSYARAAIATTDALILEALNSINPIDRRHPNRAKWEAANWSFEQCAGTTGSGNRCRKTHGHIVSGKPYCCMHWEQGFLEEQDGRHHLESLEAEEGR